MAASSPFKPSLPAPDHATLQAPNATDWWRGGVIYEIYVRSFADSNGDGTGDLAGITAKLGYVRDLGADAIWLTPFFQSPMRDFGYDVTDYKGVDPLFGSLADFDRLVERADSLDLKVVVDLVFSHTSDQHPWFLESRRSPTGSKADWYVWADPRPDGTPPNNWLSVFGGSAWTWETRRRQYYLHNFLKEQPDLNHHQPEVLDALLDAAEFWLQRGVKGLRLDAANFYMHDPLLRDNPPWPAGQPYEGEGRADNPYFHQRHLYDKSQPENLRFLRRLRQLLNRYPGSMAVGEIADDEPMVRTAEYIQAEVLPTAYNFSFLAERFSPEYVAETLQAFERATDHGWPSWAFSNHDVTRVASRWTGSKPSAEAAKAFLALLLTLRGTVFLYQGEELGFPEAELTYEQLQDPYGLTFWPDMKGRDGCRTPMTWDAGLEHGGFSSVNPWLPVAPEHLRCAVSIQRDDPASVLNFARQLLSWRKEHPALIQGGIQFSQSDASVLVFERRHAGRVHWCAFNFSPTPRDFTPPFTPGKRHLAHRAEPAGDRLTLHPFGVFLTEGHG
jgi:alpha-glucosidase